jgi:hypothetical protein
MRMTMRLAYATVNPVTIMSPCGTIAQRWPFAALLPTGTTPPSQGPIDVIQAPPYPYVGSYNLEGEDTQLEVEGEEKLAMYEAQERLAQEAQRGAREGLETRRSGRTRGRGQASQSEQERQEPAGAEQTAQVEQRGVQREQQQRQERRGRE